MTKHRLSDFLPLDHIDPEHREKFLKLDEDTSSLSWQEMDLPAPPERHDAPELEALIPVDLSDGTPMYTTGRPMYVTSMKGLGPLNRAKIRKHVQELGIDKRSVAVANAMASTAEGTVTVTILSIPGIDQARLDTLVPTMAKQPGARCAERRVGNKTVYWCDRPEFQSATWAKDGLIHMVSASTAARLAQVVTKLI